MQQLHRPFWRRKQRNLLHKISTCVLIPLLGNNFMALPCWQHGAHTRHRLPCIGKPTWTMATRPVCNSMLPLTAWRRLYVVVASACIDCSPHGQQQQSSRLICLIIGSVGLPRIILETLCHLRAHMQRRCESLSGWLSIGLYKYQSLLEWSNECDVKCCIPISILILSSVYHENTTNRHNIGLHLILQEYTGSPQVDLYANVYC